MTVYSVDHLFGYFSAFNVDVVEAVELSKAAMKRGKAAADAWPALYLDVNAVSRRAEIE